MRSNPLPITSDGSSGLVRTIPTSTFSLYRQRSAQKTTGALWLADPTRTNSGRHTLVEDLLPADLVTGSTSVEVIAIDDYMEERGSVRVDLMKVDVEGYEAAVLRGSERCLSGPARPRALIVEVMPAAHRLLGETPQELFDLMGRFGYEARDLLNHSRPFSVASLDPSAALNVLFLSRVRPTSS